MSTDSSLDAQDEARPSYLPQLPKGKVAPPIPGEPSPIRNNIDVDGRSVLGWFALICGVCSWVPWFIVLCFPLTLGFAGLAIWQARKKGRRRGLSAAIFGVVLAVVALVLHLSIVSLAGIVGFFFAVFGSEPAL